MDATLTQILQALINAHKEIDRLRAELESKDTPDGSAIQPH